MPGDARQMGPQFISHVLQVRFQTGPAARLFEHSLHIDHTLFTHIVHIRADPLLGNSLLNSCPTCQSQTNMDTGAFRSMWDLVSWIT